MKLEFAGTRPFLTPLIMVVAEITMLIY